MEPELRARICAEVVKILQRRRIALKLSMNELARRTGLTQAGISTMEGGGQPNPKLDTLLRIAEALDVDLGEVLSEVSRRVKR